MNSKQALFINKAIILIQKGHNKDDEYLLSKEFSIEMIDSADKQLIASQLASQGLIKITKSNGNGIYKIKLTDIGLSEYRKSLMVAGKTNLSVQIETLIHEISESNLTEKELLLDYIKILKDEAMKDNPKEVGIKYGLSLLVKYIPASESAINIIDTMKKILGL